MTTDEWSFYLLPLDDDVISLELPEFFRDNFLVNKRRVTELLRHVDTLLFRYMHIHNIGHIVRGDGVC